MKYLNNLNETNLLQYDVLVIRQDPGTSWPSRKSRSRFEKKKKIRFDPKTQLIPFSCYKLNFEKAIFY